MEKELHKIYYDVNHPAGFSTVEKLHKAVKKRYTLKKIRHWLEKQEVYTLHKGIKKKYKRNSYFLTNINELLQFDLNDMRAIQQHNDGVTFLLVGIDCFSKFGYIRPLKNKSGKVVVTALKSIINSIGKKIRTVGFDGGGEFWNGHVLQYLQEEKIKRYRCPNPEYKCSFVERLNRTLKARMFKYLTANNTYRYVDILQPLIDGYNSSVHSSTNMAPRAVNERNVLQVWRFMYKKSKTDLKPVSKHLELGEGDKVRISRSRGTFDKSYYINFSREVFVIDKVLKRNPVVYKIKDLEGETITGIFYRPELQRVDLNKNHLYKIDKILKKRVKNGKKECLVSWLGWPLKFASWVKEESLKKI